MTRAFRAGALLVALAFAACRDPAAVANDAGPPPADAVAEAGAPKPCEHRVPAELCTKCNPDLAAVFQATGDWCAEHGVPESHCFECNPGLTFAAAQPPADWCREHGVPESKCTKCHPKLVAKFIEAGDYCREHGFPGSVCPRCRPELLEAKGLPAPVFPEPGTRVRLASAQAAQDAGIRTMRVEPRSFTPAIEVVGSLAFDESKVADVAARAEAAVVELKVDVGDRVRRGQPLVVLESAAIGADRAHHDGARARLELARQALAREQELLAKGISTKTDVEAAQRLVDEAQAESASTSAGLRARGAGGGAGSRVVVTAPIAGTIVKREVVAGHAVAAGQTLVTIADVSRLWATLDVPEEHASKVRAGQRVRLELDGSDGESREGSIVRVAPSVDPRTRTVAARVALRNDDGALQAGRFVRARIETGRERAALLVPKDAVQRAERVPLVFVVKSPGLYEPLPVRLGASAGGLVEIVSGLDAGTELVTTGAFLLKTEILKDSIGAGCCEVEGSP